MSQVPPGLGSDVNAHWDVGAHAHVGMQMERPLLSTSCFHHPLSFLWAIRTPFWPILQTFLQGSSTSRCHLHVSACVTDQPQSTTRNHEVESNTSGKKSQQGKDCGRLQSSKEGKRLACVHTYPTSPLCWAALNAQRAWCPVCVSTVPHTAGLSLDVGCHKGSTSS